MMIITTTVRMSVAWLAAAVLLCSAADGQEGSERTQLLDRERQARDRIELLKQEQDFLLFEKNLFAADSKYLVLDVRAGRGTLNYRNRILRSFRFLSKGRSVPPGAVPGAIQLSSKLDGRPRTRQLVFGDSRLIIHANNARVDAGKGKNAVRIGLGAKDFGAIFYALEPGSMAYITEGSFFKLFRP